MNIDCVCTIYRNQDINLGISGGYNCDNLTMRVDFSIYGLLTSSAEVNHALNQSLTPYCDVAVSNTDKQRIKEELNTWK